jgi:2-methylcitrate dehydratase PrpD
MSATKILSEFASRTRLTDISSDAVAATKRHILDCTGVGIAATVEPAGRIVLDVTRDQGGTPQARVFGTNVRSSAVGAAWANGSLSHLLDYDDTGFSHPTACILPAALALSEQGNATGADLVAAVCVGLEVFDASHPPAGSTTPSSGGAAFIRPPFTGAPRRRLRRATSCA